MELNGVGDYVGGWGMSIATQRAKERENRTPDVEVMVVVHEEVTIPK